MTQAAGSPTPGILGTDRAGELGSNALRGPGVPFLKAPGLPRGRAGVDWDGGEACILSARSSRLGWKQISES